MNDEGLQKGAILLFTLGADEAAEVLKHLSPKEVQKLGTAMAGLSNVTNEMIQSVFSEFYSIAGEKTTIGMNSDEYIRSVLRKSLGDDKAANLIDRILQGGDTSGIESLKWMDPAAVAELIHNEHPQIIATILVHLEPEQVAEIVVHFTERLRNDVMLRISTLDGIQPNALKDLNDVLSRLLSGGSANLKKATLGGIQITADIMNYLSGSVESSAIESIRSHDPDMAQQILDAMFVFENILEIDDRGIQLLLREIQSESLIIALKGTSEELREKIFKNMSQRAAEMMREDLEAKGPVRVSEVEAEQKEILKVVRRLAEEGQISLGGKGEESFV